MNAAADAGRAAYEARFAHARPRDVEPWDSLTPEVKAMWARVESACSRHAEDRGVQAMRLICAELVSGLSIIETPTRPEWKAENRGVAHAVQAIRGAPHPRTYHGTARDVYEEGALIFPAVKVQEDYRTIEDIVRMCEMRIRVPKQWKGDFLAMLGAARIGEREILELAAEIGWDQLDAFEKRCGEVALGEGGDDDHDGLASILRPLSNINRCGEGRAGTDAHRNALSPGQGARR